MSHYPQMTSWKGMYHYIQGIKTGEFKLYDYESTYENNKRYGQPKPPMVNLPKLKDAKVPLAIF